MNERLYRWLRVAGIVLLAMIVAYGAVAVNVYSSVGKFPAGETVPPARITTIVWPTIGFPAIVAPGSELDVELDLAAEAASGARVTAALRPVRPELKGLSYQMSASSIAPARSSRWPRGTAYGSGRVAVARFSVPWEAPGELYDLSIVAELGSRTVTDVQRNSVSVASISGSDGFRFISLTDIHVHERGISGFMNPVSDKGISKDGTPVFFRRAIEQVNLIRPDFVVMVGDYVSAQCRPGQLRREFEMFYRQLPRFRVPVFMAAGNHDQYVNGIDGAKLFERNIGPLHYSFDVGNSHFAVVNTSQWSAGDRTVMSKFFGVFTYPRKWQGQVLSASDERKPETYRGQLAWLRDDAAGWGKARHRFLVMHHDPFRANGKGYAWKNQRFGLVITLGGGGHGRRALREIASKHRVDFCITGHWHSDYIGRSAWSGGGGQTAFVNQTCVGFDEGGMRDSYPGYRLWSVQGASVLGYTYLDAFHSIPFYDGSVLDGETDTDRLERPSVSARRTPAGFEAGSYLGVRLNLRGLVGVFPAGSTAVRGGTVYQAVPLSGDPGRELLYLEAGVGPGVPGASAAEVGERAVVEVVLE